MKSSQERCQLRISKAISPILIERAIGLPSQHMCQPSCNCCFKTVGPQTQQCAQQQSMWQIALKSSSSSSLSQLQAWLHNYLSQWPVCARCCGCSNVESLHTCLTRAIRFSGCTACKDTPRLTVLIIFSENWNNFMVHR